jgi:hypothetical protein
MNKLRFSMVCAVLAASVGMASSAQATALNVLWYTYADPASEYRSSIALLADTVPTLPYSAGQGWNLTYFDPGSATPDFSAYDVLVIESGEAFRTGAPGAALATPDYAGILANRALIAAARGERTFITSSDADFHAVRGNTGNTALRTCAPAITAPACWDGALGHAVNAINWAANGNGLGIVSFLDGEFSGSYWWMNQDSFLRDELSGQVNYSGSDDKPVIDANAAAFALNAGLSSQGLSHWNHSFHAFFNANIPGYTRIVGSGANPSFALAIATSADAAMPIAQQLAVPIDAPGTLLLLAIGLSLLASSLRSRKAAALHPRAR